MKIICYYDTVLRQYGYTKCENLETFKSKYPGFEPEYVFDEDSDMLNYNKQREEEWYKYASAYGLPTGLIHQPIQTSEYTFKITGFKNANRKYKVICQNTDSGSRFRATVGYIKQFKW